MKKLQKILLMILSVLSVLSVIALTMHPLYSAAATTTQTASQDESAPAEEEIDDTAVCSVRQFDEGVTPQDALEQVLAEKKPERVYENLIRASFTQLSQNYDAVYSVMHACGVPDRETILMQFVYGVDHVEHFMTFSSDECVIGSVRVDTAGSGAFYNRAERTIGIRECCLVPNESDCYLFRHEIHHAYQDTFPKSEYGLTADSDMYRDGLYYILVEGGAALQSIARSDRIETYGVKCYTCDDEQETKVYMRGRVGDTRYNMVDKTYTMLLYLLGAETLEQMHYSPDIAYGAECLSRLYGINGELFLKTCTLLALNEYTGRTQDTDMQLQSEMLEYVDAVFLQCLAQNVRSLSERQELEDFFHFYRFYKLQYQSMTSAVINGARRDTTAEHYDFSVIEDELYKKGAAIGLFRFSADETECRAAFDTLLSLGTLTQRPFLSLAECTISMQDGMMIVCKGDDCLEYKLFA